MTSQHTFQMVPSRTGHATPCSPSLIHPTLCLPPTQVSSSEIPAKFLIVAFSISVFLLFLTDSVLPQKTLWFRPLACNHTLFFFWLPDLNNERQTLINKWLFFFSSGWFMRSWINRGKKNWPSSDSSAANTWQGISYTFPSFILLSPILKTS